MLECLILGDSIAVGTHKFKTECVAYAQGGINSSQFNKKFVIPSQKELKAEVVIISLGSNDHKGIKTHAELLELRNNVRASRVYWVLPNPEKFYNQSEDVKLVAQHFGDIIIKPTRYQPDQVHPSWAGYKQIAKEAE